MDILLLGSVEIDGDGSRLALDRSAERCVLATLAFNVGRPVQVDTLVGHLWAGDPPAKAEETVATHVRAVRRAIERAGGRRDWLVNRRPRAYELHVDPAAVDYHRFVTATQAARASAQRGDRRDAVDAYEHALQLWRGDALGGIDTAWADGRRYTLARERLDALCACLDLRLELGEYAAVARRATQLLHDEPTERVLMLAMRGLAGSGDRSLVPDLVARGSDRMWEVAGVRPGLEIAALAQKLTASGSVSSRIAPEPMPQDPKSKGTRLIASNNVYVWQSSGDQFIL